MLEKLPMDFNKPTKVIESYACYNKDESVRINSSSGGVFYSLAKHIIENKQGYVCGAAFNDEMELTHVIVDNLEDVKKLMGSKYLYSNTKNTFEETKNLLDKNEFVLYSGLPCQIAGLKTYLRKEYSNLITVDVFCHGAPTAGFFKKYLKEIQKKDNKIINFNFRNKKNGWYNFYIKIDFDQSNSIMELHSKNPYMYYFLKDYILLDACYECKFKINNNSSDFFIGDYWGIEKVHKNIYDNKGASVCILKTEKSIDFFNEIKNDLKYELTNLEYITKYNSLICTSAKTPDNKENIIKYLDMLGFKKLFIITFLPRFIKKLKIYLKHGIKKLLKLFNLIKEESK